MRSDVQNLRPSDVTRVSGLVEAAGWNQTETDLLRFLELAPEGCFGIECEGVLAATSGAVCYGERLAWIGMVLTLPAFRGRGFARRLMECTLEHLGGRGATCIKLDATEMGHALYRKLGFEDECAVERWAREPGEANASGLSGFTLDAALDSAAFGADRSALLRSLSREEAVSIPGIGYAMGRPGRLAAYFGPCVAASPEAARSLLRWFLARHRSERIFWDLLPDNPDAVKLARSHGFAISRRLVRMRRASHPVESKTGALYAIAGFEYG